MTDKVLESRFGSQLRSVFAKSPPPDYFVPEGDDMEPTAAQYRSAVSSVIASSTFKTSPRLAELLSYLVEQKVAGNGDRLKGYPIALDVFGRDEDFDASSDSLVRVQMTRLRKALSEYYAKDGIKDRYRIVVPRGSYVPGLELPEEQQLGAGGEEASGNPSETEPSSVAPQPFEIVADSEEDIVRSSSALTLRRRAWGLLAALALIAAVLIVYWPGEDRDAVFVRAGEMPTGPVVYVAPYALSGETGSIAPIREGLRNDLINYLSQLPNLAVIAFDDDKLNAPHDLQEKSKARRGLPPAFVFQGSIAVEGGSFRVSSRLARMPGGVIVWSERSDPIDFVPTKILSVQSDIALGVASRLGQPYGVIHETMRQDLENHRDVSMDHYYCELQAYQFMRAREEGGLDRVKECLERAVYDKPNYSSAWALLSWVRLFEAQAGGEGDSPEALEAAKRAVAANATNAIAYTYLALAYYRHGEDDAARDAIGKALEISPNNSEVLANGGRLLSALGEREIAPALARKAIRLNPGHPPWYWSGLTIDALHRKDGPEAVHFARLNAEDRGLLSRYLLASAYALDGRGREAADVLGHAARAFPDVSQDRSAVARELRLPDFVTAPLVDKGLMPGQKRAAAQ
ncbi:MAG: tetratricopeptide repeat protein [Novosphingobium sp.]|uniref:tetratricopeptide repeat protein n=1 Tax=Novosphingobium sp. TaxID=1874826 RepID=UPI0012CA74F8|nr:tetratricopeptide repeat protein [Novosphingobium sp.]MPS69524.1 tetratricopeptide repeat protein [Novosphingobium sp.]